MSQRFLTALADAIRIPTVSGDSRRIVVLHRLLADRFPRTWGILDRETVSDGTLLLRWPGSDAAEQPVLLMAHQDVVPVEAGSWPHPPFDGVTAAGYLWGRGTVDDKGGLVAILEATESLLSEGFSPSRDLYLLFGHDEELGGAGAQAAADLLTARGIRFEVVLDEGGFVLTDPPFPGLDAPLGLIGVAEKGVFSVELVADGDPGHASAPPRHTAVAGLAEAIGRVERRPMPARLEAIVPLLEALLPHLEPRAALAYRTLPKLAPLTERLLAANPITNALIRTTIAPTMLAGSDRPNVLAARARAVMNVRVLPGDSTEAVLAHLREVVGDRAAVRPLGGGTRSEPSPVTDHNSEPFRDLADTVAELFPGTVAAPWVLVAATDSRHLAHLADHVLRFRPFRISTDDRSRIHGVGERIRLDDAEPAVELHRRLIRRWCG